VTRKIAVPEVFLKLVLVPALDTTTSCWGGAMDVAGRKRVDEINILWNYWKQGWIAVVPSVKQKCTSCM
jgi:hypothetical protein